MVAMLFVLLTSGCAVVRPARVPHYITVESATAAVSAQTRKMDDFTGTARVRISMKGSAEQTATLSIRCLDADHKRVLVKGIGGLVGAIIWTTPDSLYGYWPPENTWLGERLDDTATERLLAGMGIDMNLLRGAFGIRAPDGFEDGGWHAALSQDGRHAALSLSQGDRTVRYVLEGPALRVVEEIWSRNGEIELRKKAAGFREGNGGIFPRLLTIEHGDVSVVLEYSTFMLSSGLTAKDVVFSPPASAERLRVE